MARYRHVHRSALLNLTVVALAAATATLWIAHPILPGPQAFALHLHPPSQTRASVTAPAPASAGAPDRFTPIIASTPVATAAATETATPTATAAAAATPAPIATAETTEADEASPALADVVEAAAPASSAGSQSESDESDPPAAPTAAAPPPVLAPHYAQAQAAQTAFLRTDPTVAALIVGSLPPGSIVSVVGCANGCNWLLVTLPGGGEAWSEAYFYHILDSLAGR